MHENSVTGGFVTYWGNVQISYDASRGRKGGCSNRGGYCLKRHMGEGIGWNVRISSYAGRGLKLPKKRSYDIWTFPWWLEQNCKCASKSL